MTCFVMESKDGLSLTCTAEIPREVIEATWCSISAINEK